MHRLFKQARKGFYDLFIGDIGRMKIIEDKGQKEGKHILKNEYWKSIGVEVERLPLPVGDYIVCDDKVEELLSRKAKRGVAVEKMDFMGCFSVAVDTKQDLEEIIGNICGKQHERFRDEVILAQRNNVRLVILIESNSFKCIDDIAKWTNPRLIKYNKVKYMKEQGKYINVPLAKQPPTSGVTLAKAMKTMQEKYGVEFQFAPKTQAGQRVIDILNGVM